MDVKDDVSNSEDGDIFINSTDGLPCDHPVICDEDESEMKVDEDSFDDLPKSIIVTNINSEVFASEESKEKLESLFKAFGENVTFQWLKSFKRLRVNYDSPISAANARIQLHQYKFETLLINCYFAQPVTPITNKSLQPPAPYKQFLISPPASPPAGWEPREEGEPIVNQDLLAALASLTPGASHELLAQTENKPGIFVHVAPKAEEGDASEKPSIVHTRCPERM